MNQNKQGRTILVAVAAVFVVAGCASLGMGKSASQQISLSGANEVPPVSTGASGSGTVTVNADCAVTARVNVTGMTATAAHIHSGAAGTNGPVIVPLVMSGPNTFIAGDGAKMTGEQCAGFRAGNTYVNVHSEMHKPGEVRAQLKGN